MAIKISSPNDLSCISCSEPTGDVSIEFIRYFRRGTQGTSITLCKKCAKKLYKKLGSLYGTPEFGVWLWEKNEGTYGHHAKCSVCGAACDHYPETCPNCGLPMKKHWGGDVYK